jgi:phosphotransacetylase
MAKQITTEEIITKYPKIFEDYQGNPDKVNWYGVPTGWLPIIDKLCGCIQSYIDNHVSYTKDGEYRPAQVTCTQMKEKFGGLRFYTNGHDEMVEGMIRMAEHLCYNTCEECGTEEDLGVTSGWISIKCRNCVISHGDIAMNSWKPKT